MEGYLWKKRYYPNNAKKGELRQRFVILDEEENCLKFKTSKDGEKVHKKLPLDEILSIVEYGDHGFLMAMRQVATHEISGAAFLFEIEPAGMLNGLNQEGTRKLWVEKLKGNINGANSGLDLMVKNQEKIHHRYDILLRSPRNVLGTGMNGDVRLIHRKSDKKGFAMKTISLTKTTPAQLGALRREMDIMKSLDHPHIVRLQEVYVEAKIACRFVLEVCDGGELLKRLKAHNHFSERYTGKLIATMLKVLNYLLLNNIVHRDLKLENWLFRNKEHEEPCFFEDKHGKRKKDCDCITCEDPDIALIDFGLSRRFRSREEVMIKPVGTCYYVAPEVLKGEYKGNSCDMWSLGVITFMMLSGEPPFAGRNDEEIIEKVEKFECPDMESEDKKCVWSHISEECKDFVRSLLTKDPTARMTTEQAMKHPWVAQHLMHSKSQKLYGLGGVSQASSRNLSSSPEHMVDDSIVTRLRNFVRYKELKRLALEVIAFSLDHQEVKELAELFEAVDSDNDGYITYQEMAEALRDHTEIEEKEVHEIFDALDEEKTGKVHVIEFVAGTLPEKFHLEKQFLGEAFSRLDKGQKGKITLEDLQGLLGKAGNKERITKIWEESGLQEDCVGCELDIEDFMHFMRSDGELAEFRDFTSNSTLLDDSSLDLQTQAQVAAMRQVASTAKTKRSNTSSTKTQMKGKQTLRSLSRMRRVFSRKSKNRSKIDDDDETVI